MQVAVCIITYQRPQGLTRLLEGLNGLTFEGEAPEIRCIVVDNDEADTAREVCELIRPGFQWGLECHLEPQRGIPFARNRAVACALDGADFIAFIDDDEVPEPSWLQELLGAQRVHSADVVTGPQLRTVDGDVPEWIRRGRILELRRHKTGREMLHASTGNVLARAEVFRTIAPVFDERFGLAGGSDVHFFRRVHLAGYKIVWCDEAVVHEHMPAERATAKWILRRAYHVGNTWALLDIELGSPLTTRAALAVQSLWSAAKGIILLPLGLVLGKRGLVRACWHLCRAAGTAVGLVGVRFEQYRRSPGP
jgi:GT2 family glycosyltransferase